MAKGGRGGEAEKTRRLGVARCNRRGHTDKQASKKNKAGTPLPKPHNSRPGERTATLCGVLLRWHKCGGAGRKKEAGARAAARLMRRGQRHESSA